MDVNDLATLETHRTEIVAAPKGTKTDNPMLAKYNESRSLNEALSVKVTAKLAPVVERKLRGAAMDSGYGVTVRHYLTEDPKDSSEVTTLKGVMALAESDPDREIWVAFKAGPKRVNKPTDSE